MTLRQRSGRPVSLLRGYLLPRKDRGPDEESGEEEAMEYPTEEEDPQFLDAEEMSRDGVLLKSARCRSRTVVIEDKICKQQFEVTGRFPLTGPWWEVRVKVKRVGTMYYVQGYPSYFLRADFEGDRQAVLSLFLKECRVPQEFIETFLNWLPQRLYLTFHNLEEMLQQFKTAMESEKGGCDILIYVEKSCTGVNVNNALRFPLIMEYLPTLLPRLFKNLLKQEAKRCNNNGEETDVEQEGLFANVYVLTKIEDMLNEKPWKLGFSRITYKELHVIRCEVSWKAFQQCEPLLLKIPELQMNALIIYNLLKQKCRELGDTYVEQNTLTSAVSQDMAIEHAWEALEFLKVEEIVLREKDRIFLPNLYFYEKDIARCIEKLMNMDPWHLNVDVEQVLRAGQVKPVEAEADDTMQEIIRNELELQEPGLSPVDTKKNSVLQDAGQETVEGSSELELDPDQVKAAEMICSNPVTIISGKGGCGKTTVVSLIFKHLLSKDKEEVEKACRAFETDTDASEEWSTQAQQPVEQENWEPMKVLLTAPTGKAASLLRKKTNLSSFTLHQITSSYYHWLKSKSENKWKFSTVEVLVVDEGSLVSVQILSSVLKLMCKHAKLAKLVILGDVRQLPSIDPGNMLADVFQSAKDIHWAIELRTNHRAESQLIVDNATRISEQRFMQFDADVKIGSDSAITMPSSDKKFIFVSLPTHGNDDDLQCAIKMLLEKGPGLEDDKTSQFIAFRRLDCDLINELCCKRYSSHSTKNHKNKPMFQRNDKVCCTKNAYVKDLLPEPKSPKTEEEEKCSIKSENKEERLCNGEIFFITDDVENDQIRCLTLNDMGDREYILDYWKLYRDCDIKHAWARTIHTFQGSEEGTIVYVVGTAGRQHWQHVYTAVTRGRQRVYIVAKEDQLTKALFNKSRPRKTRLRQCLKEKLAQRNDCSAPTSSPPIEPSQQNCVPSIPIVSNQAMNITPFPYMDGCGEKDIVPTGRGILSNQSEVVQIQDGECDVNVYDEMTDLTYSEMEAIFQSPDQKELCNAIPFSQSPLILKETMVERHDLQAPVLCPSWQQEQAHYGTSTHGLADGGFASTHGSGDGVGVPSSSNGVGNADSFGELTDSDMECLYQSPVHERPTSGGNAVSSPGHKRLTSDEDGLATPSKIRRVILDQSPLGITRLQNLSLTSACQKQLFKP